MSDAEFFANEQKQEDVRSFHPETRNDRFSWVNARFLQQSPAVQYLDHATDSKALPPPEPTMRQERTVQASIFDVFARHEIGHELQAMSQWLDEHSDLLGLVAARSGSVRHQADGSPGSCPPKRCCAARSSSNIGS